MSSATPMNKMPAGEKKYSPVFLAVFAVFLTVTAICVAGTIVGVLEARLAHHDTQWFWAAGRLLAHGQNPYDRQAIRAIETELGLPLKSSVPMTLNPPYSLWLMVPIGLLGPRAAAVAWSLLLAAFFVVSVLVLRGMVNGPYERGYMLLAWFFAPALCCIEVGQTGLITLLGLVLFLRLERNQPFWAGVALSLCAVKPHLILPFGVVLIVWIAARRKWTVVAGAISALAVESVIAMLFDHAIWRHYRALMSTERFVDEFIPTFGVALRFAVDRTAMWLEFVPAAVGSVWGLWYFWRHRETWDWRVGGILVVLVSLVAAPYAWFTDQVIALPAIVFALTWPGGPRKGSVTLLLLLMSLAGVDMMITKDLFTKADMLLGVAWLVWYLYAVSGEARAKASAMG